MIKKILFPILAIVAGVSILTQTHTQANPDVVSAASLTVSIINIKDSSAMAQYTRDKYDYGTRTLCYNPAPAVASLNCTTRNASGNSGTMDLVKLTPGTLYNFSIKAIDTKGGEKPYTTSGSFTTTKSGTATISLRNPNKSYSVASSSLQKQRVNISGKGSKQVQGKISTPVYSVP